MKKTKREIPPHLRNEPSLWSLLPALGAASVAVLLVYIWSVVEWFSNPKKGIRSFVFSAFLLAGVYHFSLTAAIIVGIALLLSVIKQLWQIKTGNV